MTTTVPSTAVLYGRTLEVARLGRLMDDLRQGGGCVVVRGAAGIGKSALLAQVGADARLRGLQVLRAEGVESEASLPYAGLQQLLAPVLVGVMALVAPQRRALLSALGLLEASAADLFLVALAALNLVAESAARAPAVLLLEDVQWLDPSTTAVLSFLARRLKAEPVLMVAALRDGHDSDLGASGSDELRLSRLDDTAARALLQKVAPSLANATQERVLQAAEGNPLALIELPATVEAGAGVLSWLPLTTRLATAFSTRLSGLPTSTRTLLLVTALCDGDSLAEVLAAADVLGTPGAPDDLAPAVSAGLLEMSGQTVRFRHPLMRSVVHQRASMGQRQRAHAALAVVLEHVPDRQVWHRAAAVVGPDERIAADLKAAAVRAQQRGGVPAALRALERAVALTDEPVARATRLLRAAELAVELGQLDVVVRLLGQTAPVGLPTGLQAEVTFLRESFYDGVPGSAGSIGMLVELARTHAALGEQDLALRLLWAAALRCAWAEADASAKVQVVSAAGLVGADPQDPRVLAVLAFAAPLAQGAAVIEGLRRWPRHALGGDAQAARLLGSAAGAVGAYDLSAGYSRVALPGLREQGRLGLLARALLVQSWAAVNGADLDTSIPAADEAARLAAETQQPVIAAMAHAVKGLIAALQDDPETADAEAVRAEQVAGQFGAAAVLAAALQARGLAALSRGRPGDAYEHLLRVHHPADAAYHVSRCYELPDLAEAARHSGHVQDLHDVIREMEALASKTPSPSLHLGLRHARAVLADDDDAEELFAAALRADLRTQPYARARAQLAYGKCLRRQRRAADSRGPLRAARETFDALGCTAWSRRARQELRASGERSRQRTPMARDQLSGQELQIAQLAGQGLTNREIGELLYLSHRTVSSHLHRMFPKLGITSRSELPHVLEAADSRGDTTTFRTFTGW